MARSFASRLVAAVIAVGALFLGTLLPTQTLAAGTSDTVKISKIGTRAFEDLATCLASYKEPVLDVFYLVDFSGSLSFTDPEYVRSEVLGSSIRELNNFAEEGVEINYASALFGSNIENVQKWTKLSNVDDFDAAASRLTKQISRNFGGQTDWEAGLKYAKKQLTSKPSNHCKMLIWFTDGGINPTGYTEDALTSLSNLCSSSLTATSLGNSNGPFGLMSEIRSSNISIFGILYQNDDSTLKHYMEGTDQLSEVEAKKLLESEHNSMEFMSPLVEGIGQITTKDPFGGFPGPGRVQCGPLDEAGFSPAGQPNGAFMRAQDPVDLAYQFMNMQAVLAGGSGRPIVDGQFTVPPGTAAFRILTTSDAWKLSGPEDSSITVSDKSGSSSKVQVSSTAGVQQIDVKVSGSKNMLGAWKFDSGSADSALYLYSGLTIELDRDQSSQIVSDRDNSLTGRIVRRAEFQNMPVDLSIYPKAELSLSQPDATGNLKQFPNITARIDKSGQFKIEGLKPDVDARDLELWISLDIGDEFSPVTANFGVDIVSKKDIATSATNVITLSPLVGPTGIAKGSISVVGPTSQPESEFCIQDPEVRTDDVQTDAQKHPRDDGFTWKFDGNLLNGSEYCVVVSQGETKVIDVEVTNPTQANGKVISVRAINSKSAGASLAESVNFEFESKAEVNEAAAFWVSTGLLILGILLPLGLLYLLNWLTTLFLPLQQTVRAEYPVQIVTGATAKVLGKDGSPLKVEPNDFKFLTDAPASKKLAIGAHGEAQAKIAAFPLLPSWFEQNAKPGQRVISLYSESGKGPSHFRDGKTTEISPNHAANWFISVPEAEFSKPNGEPMNGILVVAARMGSLPQYQSRVQELSSKPGLQGRIDEIRAAMEAEASKNSGKTPKEPKALKAGKPGLGGDQGSVVVPPVPTIPGATGIPGVPISPTTPAGSSGPGVPSSPPIPGVPSTGAGPSIPGVPNSNPIPPPSSIPGVPNNIPGINPPS